MEAQAQSLKQLAQKLDGKRQVECRGAIESLLPEQRNAIQDGLVELVKRGTLQSDYNAQFLLLINYLNFFRMKRFLNSFKELKLVNC